MRKYRVKKTQKIKVQHGVTVCDFPGDQSPDKLIWSKAKVEDLIELGINCA